MKLSDLLAELERDRPRCPVCQRRVIPSRGEVKIISFPVDVLSSRLALLPVHSECFNDARERIDAAKAAIRERADAAETN